MKIKYFLALLLPVVAFASGNTEEGGTDIIPRAINFLIFAGLMYYLLADKMKTFFKGRGDEIADRLSSIQEKLKESKNAKEEAVKKIEDAKVSAVSIVETAKKEAEIITKKIGNDLKTDLVNLGKSHNEKIEIEERKMNRAVVDEVLNEIFKEGNVELSNDDFINIINKKAA